MGSDSDMYFTHGYLSLLLVIFLVRVSMKCSSDVIGCVNL